MIRRDFLKSGALATGALMIPNVLHGRDNPKIRIGVVGTGWWACDYLIPAALRSGLFDIVAICDVDQLALQKASGLITAKGYTKPAAYVRHTEMYRHPGLQAVVISTPTHWHALQYIDACGKGLHVFLEKPVSYDIREGIAMLRAKQNAGIITQVDFPRVLMPAYSEVKEYIGSGETGTIRQVKAQINHPELPMVEKKIPESLDFDTYCGPAPRVKYLCFEDSQVINWRGIHDLSRGLMVDWGIHYLHNVRTILGLNLPEEVAAIGGITNNFSYDNPDHLNVRYQFGDLPVNWSQKTWGIIDPDPAHKIGVYYFGEKATLFASDRSWEVYTPDGQTLSGEALTGKQKDQREEDSLRPFEDLFIEFSDAIRSKDESRITNRLDEALQTTSMVIFGDLAYRTDSMLQIDTQHLSVTNNEKAQSQTRREYQTPYIHPGAEV